MFVLGLIFLLTLAALLVAELLVFILLNKSIFIVFYVVPWALIALVGIFGLLNGGKYAHGLSVLILCIGKLIVGFRSVRILRDQTDSKH